jgi:ectoine hydroxylase-related dioxygenase (phytanoyl-CoA dioxygenase family)
VTAEEIYLFDLHGFIVVRNAIDPDHLAEIHDVLDEKGIPELLESINYLHTGFSDDDFYRGNQDPDAGPVDVSLGLLLDWGAPIRRLVSNDVINPFLETMLGDGFRLDHAYAIFMAKGAGGTVPHHLHNGGSPFDPTQYYIARDGSMHNGMCVVSYALNDVPAGSGGFCAIPGSHKSAFPIPPSIAAITDATPPVVHIPVNAGDAIIFSEAVTHGAIPWRDETPRRSLLFKFCPGHIQWERDSPFANLDHEWTEQELRILAPPYAGRRGVTLAPAPIPVGAER